MKNKKLFFSEARFVFGKPTETGKVWPPQRPRVEKTGRKLSVATKSKRNRVTHKSTLKRGVIKPVVDFTKLDLEGVSFSLPFSVKNGKVELSPNDLVYFKKRFSNLFGKVPELEAMKNVFASAHKINVKEAGDMLENVYASHYLTQLQAAFGLKYPYLEKYVKLAQKGDFKVKGSIKRVGGGFDVEFKAGDKQLEGYPDWVKKNKEKLKSKSKSKSKPGKKPGKAAGKLKQAPDPERDLALARFSKTSMGRLFNGMKDEKGVSMLEKIRDGKAPMFILAVLGLLGFKTLGGGVWEGIRDFAKGSQADGKLAQLEKKARGFRFAAVSEEQKRFMKFEQRNTKQFGEFLAGVGKGGGDIPKKGLRLTQPYGFRDKVMTVTLGKGGRMVIPGPAKILVNGKSVSVPKGKVRSYDVSQGETEVKIGGTLSKGTTFEGKVTLAIVSASASVSTDKTKKTKAVKPGSSPTSSVPKTKAGLKKSASK